MQKIIEKGGPLLKEDGSLQEAGYAKSLVKEYRRGSIKANGFRIKEWDYYLIYDGHRALCLTIADNSYMGDYSVSWIDFDRQIETTKSVMTVLPRGKTQLPVTSESGDVSFHNKKIDIAFENDGNKRTLCCVFPNFKDGETLEANITLTDIPTDSMVIMTPYKENKKAFYYNQKINCMNAKGYVNIGNHMHVFKEDAYGSLDWGRGVWTYRNTWYWSSASGSIDGHRFGFNLGYGFGDTSAASENMLFYDGIGHKLEDIVFQIPVNEKGREDWLKPWTFTSSDGRFEAKFEPILNRSALINVFLIKTDQNQVFGYFTGDAVLDDGTVVHMDHFLGFAEKVYNRW